MKILYIDPGKKFGWAVIENDSVVESGHSTFKSCYEFKQEITDLILTWKPDAVGASKPNRFYPVIFAHAVQIGIIETAWQTVHWDKLGGKAKIHKFFDPEIKKWAFGKVRGLTKQDVLDKYGGDTDDEADARMAGLYFSAKAITI